MSLDINLLLPGLLIQLLMVDYVHFRSFHIGHNYPKFSTIFKYRSEQSCIIDFKGLYFSYYINSTPNSSKYKFYLAIPQTISRKIKTQLLAAVNLKLLVTYAYKGVRSKIVLPGQMYRGSYMSAHLFLNLLNELGKRDKMRGLSSTLSLFHNEFNKFNDTRARMLDSFYHMTLRLI